MKIKGINLSISDKIFVKYWKYDKGWWPDFLAYLQDLRFNSILFWPYSNILVDKKTGNYFKWLLEKTEEMGLNVFYHLAPEFLSSIDPVAIGLELPLSYMVHYYDHQESKENFRRFLEKLKEHKKSPTLIVRGYGNTPFAIREARKTFLDLFPSGEFWTTRKYSYEHFAGTEPTLDTKLFSESAAGNLIIWLQTCGDFDPFHVISPEYIAKCLSNCRKAGAHGIIFHPPHWWTFQTTSSRKDKRLEYQRDFLWYKSFSLYASRDFKKEDRKFWEKELAKNLETERCVKKIYKVIDKSGRFIPTISDLFWYSVDFQYHPQTASVFHKFVEPEVYAALRPRHHQYPSIAEGIAAHYISSSYISPQIKEVSDLSKSIEKEISKIREKELNDKLRNLFFDCECINLLAKFWVSYLKAIEYTYKFISSGDKAIAKKAIGMYQDASDFYKETARRVEANYDGFTLGIWDEITTWSENIARMDKVLKDTSRKIEHFEDIPVYLVGDLLDRNVLWYRQIMSWPFEMNSVNYFPCHQVVPFTVKKGIFSPDKGKLLIIQKDIAPVLPFRKEILQWVRNGGKVLFYNIVRNFSSDFFPVPIKLGFFANIHVYDNICFKDEVHPLASGFANRVVHFIPDSTGIKVGTCITDYGKGWKVLAVVDEEVALGTPRVIIDKPAILLVLPYGKGEIAYSGIRVPEVQIAGGYPPKETEKNETIKNLVKNWFLWIGEKIAY